MERHDYWAVVPAAGVGKRMGSEIPKQYLPLHGKPIIQHTLSRLAGHPSVIGIVVALAQADPWWDELDLNLAKPLLQVSGGPQRCHSVLHGLAALEGRLNPEGWVLVHDAVRPCVSPADIHRLIERVATHPVGGLLGLPVRDTMKRTDAHGEVEVTVERARLWHALTPQMFRLGKLTQALAACIAENRWVTDEAQAMELQGYRPCMVAGAPDNIKVTQHEDLLLAAHYLSRQAAAR